MISALQRTRALQYFGWGQDPRSRIASWFNLSRLPALQPRCGCVGFSYVTYPGSFNRALEHVLPNGADFYRMRMHDNAAP